MLLLTAGLLAGALGSPPSSDATLRIGDPAPEVEIRHWIRTGVLEAPDRTGLRIADGKVTVIEFWATWCGPCLAGFPELSEIQEEFAPRDVRIVALSDEPLSTCVELMLRPASDGERFGDRMGFSVASDPDGSTHRDLLLASGRAVYPRSFLIGPEGVIEWIGHPKTDGLREAIADVLDGSWDRDAYRASFEDAEREEGGFAEALERKDWDRAESLLEDDWVRTNQLAFAIALGTTPDDVALLERAERLAERARRLSNSEEAFVFHVLALIRYRYGDVAEAAALERRAIELDDGRGGAYYQQALDQYESELDDDG